MKIISPFKDYYDYLQGIYGTDEKIVYERICQERFVHKPRHEKGEPEWKKVPIPRGFHNTSLQLDKHIIHICGVQHVVFIYKGEFYYGQEGGDFLADNHRKDLGKWERELLSRYGTKRPKWYRDNGIYEHLKPTPLNLELGTPVVIEMYGRYVANIRLSDLGLNKFIPAEDIYLTISQFLSKTPDIIDNRGDVEKLESHGFDKITSFRNM